MATIPDSSRGTLSARELDNRAAAWKERKGAHCVRKELVKGPSEEERRAAAGPGPPEQVRPSEGPRKDWLRSTEPWEVTSLRWVPELVISRHPEHP